MADEPASADLRAAASDAAAVTNDSLDTVSAPCLLVERHPIEVTVFDDDDRAVRGVALELRQSPTSVVRTKTNKNGIGRFEGLMRGTYELGLHRLDERAWEMVASFPLPPPKTRSSDEVPWRTPEPDGTGDTDTIIVEQGDSIARIAAFYGFDPATLWKMNGHLQGNRREREILYPGDKITVPRIQKKWMPVATGNRYYIHRIGIPYILAIRFLDAADQPRSRVPYLLEVEASHEAFESREGETDDDGFVIEPIPCDAIDGTLLLGRGESTAVHKFRFGHMDPVEAMTGVQKRLNNLGYSCGTETGVLDDSTQRALRYFQHDYGLTVTGAVDDETRQRLSRLHLS